MKTDALSPVAIAVEPLRKVAADRAREYTAKVIASYKAKIAEAGMDMNKAFPSPSGGYGKAAYQEASRKRALAQRITSPAPTSHCIRRGEPLLVEFSDEYESRVMQEQLAAADEQYRLYVGKLESKVGEVAKAELTGDAVWSYSLLTVTLHDGSVQRWTTRMIVNYSKFGLPFNQWPTRRTL